MAGELKDQLTKLGVTVENMPTILQEAAKNPDFIQKAIKAQGNSLPYRAKDTLRTESPLAGKQFAFLGSSVTYGAGSFGESFADFLAEKDDLHPFKEAVSGTKLVKSKDSYLERLYRLPALEELSAFVLQLSTNDATQGEEELGEISDGNYDQNTVTGALEFILDYIKKTWNCPVIVFSSPKFENNFYDKMVMRTKELQEKWGFKFLNFWADDEFFFNEQDKKLYMLDERHPTRAGYKLAWAPKFEEVLTELSK